MVDPAAMPRPLLRTMLGEVLRRTRLDQERTLADVARAARVSMPYLSELERGRKEASSEILAAICEALGIELSEVLAQVGADLAEVRIRQAQLIRLDEIRERHGLPPARGAGSMPIMRGSSGDAVCLAA
jgi:transcriptional regulator with XRE-family HTH domain